MTAGATAGERAGAGDGACATAANPFNSDDTISPMVKTVSPSKTLEVLRTANICQQLWRGCSWCWCCCCRCRQVTMWFLWMSQMTPIHAGKTRTPTSHPSQR